jgi:hypothetical protein
MPSLMVGLPRMYALPATGWPFSVMSTRLPFVPWNTWKPYTSIRYRACPISCWTNPE